MAGVVVMCEGFEVAVFLIYFCDVIGLFWLVSVCPGNELFDGGGGESCV